MQLDEVANVTVEARDRAEPLSRGRDGRVAKRVAEQTAESRQVAARGEPGIGRSAGREAMRAAVVRVHELRPDANA